MTQSLLLGASFVAIATVTGSAYALAAGAVAPGLAGAARLGRAAAVYIGLGLLAAWP